MRLFPSGNASRRISLWLAVATVLPLAGLVWLGRAIVEQDATSARDRTHARREQVLDLAVASLARTIAQLEERLNAAMTDSPRATDRPRTADDDVAVARFDRRGLVVRDGAFLPYYPVEAATPAPASQVFDEATRAELVETDLSAALARLEELTRASDPVVRAEAWLRIARVARKAGDVNRALAAYMTLESLDNVRADDRPAGLAARQGRALLFASLNRAANVEREAQSLQADLVRGRWLLTETQYAFAMEQAREWAGTVGGGAVVVPRRALADAMDLAWREWRGTSSDKERARRRRSLRTEHGPVLMISEETPDQLVVLAVGRRFLETAGLAGLQPAASEAGVRLALTDGEGHPVLGTADAPRALQASRAAVSTSLPWTVHALSTSLETTGLSRSAVLALVAVGLAGAMFLVSAYVVGRAIQRQIAVTALQADFVGAVSHEFRTPLTTIRQLSEMLARGRVSTDGRRQKFYETLLRDSERLQRLVESVLDFGRMESRAAEYRFETLEPEPFVRGVVAEFQQDATADGFTIELEAAPSLPAIKADREALTRAIWNLFDNAVKYSPDQRTIHVALESSAGRVIVRVRDYGIGIPPEEQANVFKKFVRGRAAKHASIRGTGLGLAMVRQIVEAHGGRVTLESAAGAGSTFSLDLPVSEGA